MTYESNNSLAHYGIKGQKWGIRRYQYDNGSYTPEGKERYGVKSESGQLNMAKTHGHNQRPVSHGPRHHGITRGLTSGIYDRDDGTKDMKRLEKDAKKDAEDMARAKAYYGEGAGTRRKQIKNRISERMKDPDYKASYEKHLAEQDMSKHQKAANRERHMEDAKNTVAKTARGIKNLLMGVGSASLTAVALYNAAKITGVDKIIADFGRQAINRIKYGR